MRLRLLPAILNFSAGCAAAAPAQPECNTPYVAPTNLPPFDVGKSDGCSGGMSDFKSFLVSWGIGENEKLPWRSCCETHDEAYYYGESPHQQPREEADRALEMCVAEKAAMELHRRGWSAADAPAQLLAKLMYTAVRLGGGPCYVTGEPSKESYRWGFGEDWKE